MPRYDRACTNHGIVFYDNALQDCNPRTNPDIVADPNRAADERLFGNGSIRFGSMIMVRDVAEWADEAMTSHLDALRCVEHGEAVNVGATTYDQSRCCPARAGCQKHHMIIQTNHIVDRDIPRVSRHMNPADPTFPTDAGSEQPQAKNTQTNGNCSRIADEPVDYIVMDGSCDHFDFNGLRELLIRQ